MPLLSKLSPVECVECATKEVTTCVSVSACDMPSTSLRLLQCIINEFSMQQSVNIIF